MQQKHHNFVSSETIIILMKLVRAENIVLQERSDKCETSCIQLICVDFTKEDIGIYRSAGKRMLIGIWNPYPHITCFC